MISVLDALPESARILTLRAAEACYVQGGGFKRICKEMGAREYIDIVRALVAEVRDEGKEPRWSGLPAEDEFQVVEPEPSGELVLLGGGGSRKETQAPSQPAPTPAVARPPAPARPRARARAINKVDAPWYDYRWPPKFSVRKRVVCAMLLEGASLLEAAERAEVDVEVAEAWTQTGPFRAAMRQAIQERRERGVALFDAAVNDAIEVICDIMHNDQASPRDRIRAAAEILDRAGMVKEQRLEILNLAAVTGGEQGSAEQVVDIEAGGAEAEAEVLEALDAVPLALLRQALERRQAGG